MSVLCMVIKMSSSTIDAVILWVDGNDPEWIREKNRYAGKGDSTVDSSTVRYRDLGVLKYWFRAIEANMPWINRVFFITNGQYPDWLNFKCPKLRFVKHSDYMPEEYLPTFSANPIELNLHRIKELSERFIFFNDDMFVINPMEENDFFRDDFPVYPAGLHSIVPLGGKSEEIMSHIYVNDVTLINRPFQIRCIKENWRTWFNPTKVGFKNAVMSVFLSNHAGFVGFHNHHLPVPLRKSTIEELWQKEGEILHATSRNKFRSSSDVNQYVFRYWELARQSFVPIRGEKLGEYFVIHNDVRELSKELEGFKGKMICLNDSDIDEACSEEEFEGIKKGLQLVFERKYPQQSMFEL